MHEQKRAAQELLADEAADQPSWKPHHQEKAKKKKKHKEETVDNVRVGNRVSGAETKHQGTRNSTIVSA